MSPKQKRLLEKLETSAIKAISVLNRAIADESMSAAKKATAANSLLSLYEKLARLLNEQHPATPATTPADGGIADLKTKIKALGDK